MSCHSDFYETTDEKKKKKKLYLSLNFSRTLFRYYHKMMSYTFHSVEFINKLKNRYVFHIFLRVNSLRWDLVDKCIRYI